MKNGYCIVCLSFPVEILLCLSVLWHEMPLAISFFFLISLQYVSRHSQNTVDIPKFTGDHSSLHLSQNSLTDQFVFLTSDLKSCTVSLKKYIHALELNASFSLSHQCMLVENVKMSLSLPFVKSLEFRAAFKVEMLYSVPWAALFKTEECM